MILLYNISFIVKKIIYLIFKLFLEYYKKSFAKGFKNLSRCFIIIHVGHNEI